MKKYIIERNFPGAGNMTSEELQVISKTSNAVVSIMGNPYVWIESFVTENKIYCIHEAVNEEDIIEHGKCGGFPVDKIEEIKAVIGPATGNQYSVIVCYPAIIK
ncbi:MAG: DUF4242 domain-containing protein [Ginsengibacter sp.]